MPIPNFQPFLDSMTALQAGLQQFNQDSSSLDVLEQANAAAQAQAKVTQDAVDTKEQSISNDLAGLAPLVSAVVDAGGTLLPQLTPAG